MIKLKLFTIFGKNHKKAKLLRKSGLFAHYGDKGYWHPDFLPSYPELISIGNNVTVASNVRFIEHDEINRIWNDDEDYKGPKIPYYTGKIFIGDNVSIGANSIILYNVHINNNVVVAAGSVVTKDVPEYAIVAGNPAKVIGDTRKLLSKRSKREQN